MRKKITRVTSRIERRSRPWRQAYLQRMEDELGRCTEVPLRRCLPASNLAHAAAWAEDIRVRERLFGSAVNIGIVTSYSDVLSAHAPYQGYPALVKKAVFEAGGTAQVAGGVPAMCDGVTQGEPGMDLSLMSRDVIAMAVAVCLSHDIFDGVLLLGVCDKIVPGLLMGALQFGHLPMMLVPAGPMPSGIANRDKAKARELYSQGLLSREQMIETEAKAYHSKGTCTFYGTANSNQLLAEVMGLHLPGSSFVQTETPMRDAFTEEAARRICRLARSGREYLPIGRLVSEKTIVNAMSALAATGGSTNQTMHLVAVARAAGIRIDWDDFAEVSEAVPLMARIYPNGPEDINGFQEAGGVAALVSELLDMGCLHEDVDTVAGPGLERYTKAPYLSAEGEIQYGDERASSSNLQVIARADRPFSNTGGIRVLSGNLGRAVIKTSALPEGDKTVVEAPAAIFHDQHALSDAFSQGRLDRDLVAVVRFQGPRANGMPELHKLITPLGVLMDRGYKVALVTDGRLSGASGKVPAAIHVCPEAFSGGPIAKVREGDIIRIDVEAGTMELKVPEHELQERRPATEDLTSSHFGMGRQMFSPLRRCAQGPEQGASSIFTYGQETHGLRKGSNDADTKKEPDTTEDWI